MTSEIAHSLMISDLHLCDSRPDLNRAFVDFCQHRASRAQQLFVLGDLSDAWVGDDDDSETAKLIRSQFSALVQGGTQLWLMTGNRDFLMGEQLASDCSLHLLDDPSEVELYGRRMLLMHGDSLCTDDAEYMAFRAQIRNPDAQRQLLEQTLEQRRVIALALRAQSKSANASKAEDIMDVNQIEVERVMQHHGVDLLIHGHTHRPATHEFAYASTNGDVVNARRLVLGDWGESGWYIQLSSAGIDLHSFPIVS